MALIRSSMCATAAREDHDPPYDDRQPHGAGEVDVGSANRLAHQDGLIEGDKRHRQDRNRDGGRHESAGGQPERTVIFAVAGEKFGADLISVRLEGTHPEKGNRTPEQAVALVKSVLAAVEVPLVDLETGAWTGPPSRRPHRSRRFPPSITTASTATAMMPSRIAPLCTRGAADVKRRRWLPSSASCSGRAAPPRPGRVARPYLVSSGRQGAPLPGWSE